MKIGWLHSTRQAYAAMTTVLDEHVLLLSEDDLIGANQYHYITRERHQHWSTLDDRLAQVPSPLADFFGPRCDVDYTYVVDLDREIFSINFGAHFKLDQIPRQRLLDEAIRNDRYRMTTISSLICPSASIASPQFVPLGPDDRFRQGERDDPLELRWVSPIDLVGDNPSSGESVPMTISMLLLYKFTFEFHQLLQGLLREWSPDGFIFREIAYAILSIASGQMRIQATPWLQGLVGEPYLAMGNKEVRQGYPRLLPMFARGFHRPDHEPGSSPAETMYWLDGVLIGLAAMIDEPTQREVAVAKLVRFGRNHRPRREFDGLIISIEHVLLIRVRNPRHGTRPEIDVTHPIPLFQIDNHLAVDPRQRPASSRPTGVAWSFPVDDPVRSVEKVSRAFPGFRWLIRFLDQAISRALPSSASPNHGRFPAGIYEMILDQVDDPTHHSCARVCRRFRLYCHAHLRLGRGLIITQHLEGAKFIVEDRDDGETTIVKLHRQFFEGMPDWSVVVGSLDRPSLLLHVGFSFKNFNIKQDIRRLNLDRDRASHPGFCLNQMRE